MNAREAYLAIREQLIQAGIEDAGFDADALFACAAGASRFAVDRLTPAQWERLQFMAQRRMKREPLQYILGTWAFLDLELAVGPGVLVPRPETEEVCLVAAELLQHQGYSAPCILDLCSGTGALALGLQSLFPAASVTALELYPDAFRYLEQNIAAYGAGHSGPSPQAVQADALVYHQELAPLSLDLIVSNPPYVTAEEYEGLSPEVKAEPRTALVGRRDGLAFYETIAACYGAALRAGGYLVLEIGSAQGEALRDILAHNGWCNVEILPDLAGLDRIATAQKASQM